MRLVGLDTETTGLKPHGELQEDGSIGTDQIVQYTLQVWDNGVRSPAQTIWLYATIPVEPFIRKLNGYDETIWAQHNARVPDWHEPAIWALLDGAEILGSNPEFDLRFINATCRALGCTPPKPSHRRVNLNSLGMQLKALGLVKSAGLQDLASYFKISTHGAHTSDGDVRIAFDVWEAFLDLHLRAIGL